MQAHVALSTTSYFRSLKSSAPVPVSSSLRLDFLVQSALDPSVDRIDYVHSAVVSGCRVRLDLPVIVRDRTRFAVDIVEDHPLRSVDDEGLSLLAVQELELQILEIRSDDVHREPVMENARRVWSHADQEVGFDEEAAALDALSGRNFAIEQLVAMTGVPIEAIFALACADLVVLDMVTQRVCPRTTVSVSPRHRKRRPGLYSTLATRMGVPE